LQPGTQGFQIRRFQELSFQHPQENHRRRKETVEPKVSEQGVRSPRQAEGRQRGLKSTDVTDLKSNKTSIQAIVNLCQQALLKYRQYMLELYASMKESE
jgi:hypothetical protein